MTMVRPVFTEHWPVTWLQQGGTPVEHVPLDANGAAVPYPGPPGPLHGLSPRSHPLVASRLAIENPPGAAPLWAPSLHLYPGAIERSTVGAETEPLQGEFHAQQVLRDRLDQMGLTVMPSFVDEDSVCVSNAGQRSNLSLIVAMLHRQGMQGDDASCYAVNEHARLAACGDARSEALLAGRRFDADPHLFRALCEHMFGESNVPAMLIIEADAHGAPRLTDPLSDVGASDVDPATVAHDTLVILKSSWHFEAVANISGRPWSSVLSQLRMAPNKPEPARADAWLLHNIEAVRTVKVAVAYAADLSGTEVWTRGVPMRLAMTGSDAEPSLSMYARALAEAHDVVDGFWGALENESSLYLGQTENGEIRLAVSPQEYEDALPRDPCHGHVILPSLEATEDAHQYIGHFRVREGRVTDLTVFSSEGEITVKYEDPWSRPVAHTVVRARLQHPADLDAFDAFCLLPQAHRGGDYPSRFVDFLMDLQKRGKGQGWKEFRARSAKDRERYLFDAVSDGLSEAVARVVRWAIDPEHSKQRYSSAVQNLQHVDDYVAFNVLAQALRKKGNHNAAGLFASFLLYLRQEWPDIEGWDGFCSLPDESREKILHTAKEHFKNTRLPSAARLAFRLENLQGRSSAAVT